MLTPIENKLIAIVRDCEGLALDDLAVQQKAGGVLVKDLARYLHDVASEPQLWTQL